MPLSPWEVSGALMHARWIVAIAHGYQGRRALMADATGFGWLSLGAGVGAMYMPPLDQLPLLVELPPLEGSPPPWQ